LKTETGNSKLENRNWKIETGKSKLENRNSKLEIELWELPADFRFSNFQFRVLVFNDPMARWPDEPI